MGRSRSFNNEDILEKATNLFWRNGYNGTSMRELVAETGLAKASLYNAFGHKEDLFLAVLDYYIEQKQTRTLASLSCNLEGRPALQAYFAILLQQTAHNSDTPGCLLVNTAAEQGIHHEEMRTIVDKGISRTERHLIETVERGVKDGTIAKATNPDIAGSCLLTLVIGIRVMARKGVNIEKLETLVEASLNAHTPAP